MMLIQANGWRETFDQINISLWKLLEELSRINGKAFHVLTLAFRKDRVNRKRAFSTPTPTRNHHQFVSWNFNRDVFKIMSTCSMNGNRVIVVTQFVRFRGAIRDRQFELPSMVE